MLHCHYRLHEWEEEDDAKTGHMRKIKSGFMDDWLQPIYFFSGVRLSPAVLSTRKLVSYHHWGCSTRRGLWGLETSGRKTQKEGAQISICICMCVLACGVFLLPLAATKAFMYVNVYVHSNLNKKLTVFDCLLQSVFTFRVHDHHLSAHGSLQCHLWKKAQRR